MIITIVNRVSLRDTEFGYWAQLKSSAGMAACVISCGFDSCDDWPRCMVRGVGFEPTNSYEMRS